MVRNRKSKKRFNNKKYKTKRKYFQKGKGTLKLCFIIACYIPNNLVVYIDYSINKINEFYPNSQIILVDNNSENKDYYNQFKGVSNIILLENTSEQKYEIGAYNFAVEHIKKNNLIFDYYILLQDSIIPLHKYDFNSLNIPAVIIIKIERELMDCPVRCPDKDGWRDVLRSINNYNFDYEGCMNCSFISNHDTLLKIHDMTKNISIKNKTDSIVSERWIGVIIQTFNNNSPLSIDGYHKDIKYNFVDVNIKNDKKDFYFIKKSLNRV